MPGYSIQDVDRLVEGDELDERTGLWKEADRSWIRLRSWVERTGEVDDPRWHEVLDVERAVDALRNCGCSRSNLDGSGRRPRCSHKLAALVILAAMHQWDPAEMQATFAKLHTPWETLLDKGMAFVQAYLSPPVENGKAKRNGQAQKAYKAARQRRER